MIFNRIEISKGFYILIAVVVLFDITEMFVLSVVCALLHEGGHLACIYLCKGKIENVKLTVYGASIELGKYPIIPYRNEIIIAAAGPAVSLLAAVLFSYIGKYAYIDKFFLISGINLLIGVLNLIPAYPLDGGRMLKCFLLMFFSVKTVKIITSAICGICAICVSIICTYINARAGFQVTLTVFSVFVITSFVRNMLE